MTHRSHMPRQLSWIVTWLMAMAVRALLRQMIVSLLRRR